MTANSIDGTFDSLSLPGGCWVIEYGPTSVSLVAETKPTGDLDDDCDADLFDFGQWLECLSGPQQQISNECAPSDLDQEGDVDMHDAALITQSFTGSLP